MSKTTSVISENLSEFCKITKAAKDRISELSGDGSPESLLKRGWKESFEGGRHRLKGSSVIFTLSFTRPDGEEGWVEVILKKSTKEGEPLPYWTCGVNECCEAPRDADSLEDFAFLRWDLYDELANMALEESWSFTGEGNDLLRFYLNGTFLRLMDEGKLGFATDAEGDMCVWCTGLVNAHYEDIYCFCTPNDHADARQKWMVRGFCTSGSTHFGQRLRRAFGSEPPQRANYFDSISDTIYDGSLYLSIDYEHVCQRVHRIGISALRVLMASSEEAMTVVEEAAGSAPSAREGILKRLNGLVAGDIALQRSLHNALTLAAERARARARYMYTSALPSWNPRNGGSIVFCLPLCLVVEERVDTVLVARLVGDAKEPYYEGKTIFDVQMAYKSARAIQRTDGMTGWVSSAFAEEEKGVEQPASAFAAPAHSVTPSLSPTLRSGLTPISHDEPTGISPNPPSPVPMAKLRSGTESHPDLLVCDGDTIGFVRRPDEEHPRIELPAEEGFYAVSQKMGDFSFSDGSWTYRHVGANWSQIRKQDESVVILEDKGSSTPIEFGDALSFAGSPEYVFEQ